MNSNRPYPSLFAIAMLCAMAFAVWYSAYLHRPPAYLLEDAPQTEFSAMRAMAHVKNLATSPRPVGSKSQKSARSYIISEIKKIGIDAHVQNLFLNDEPGKAFFLKNIVAVLPGRDKNEKAICLTAHYDTIPFGPGAGDDASGCAVLLETMRALKSRPPMRRDIIFVFTDNEEGYITKHGTRGALAFATRHPLAKHTGCVLNFDVRGTCGPAYMFETMPGTGKAIELLAQSGAQVFASSLMPSVYKIMPLGSDFTRFIDAKIPGWNFAFVGGFEHYHNATDTPQNLSPASVQHMLRYADALISHLDHTMPSSFDGIEFQFFNVIGSLFMYYPDFLSPYLSLAGFLALLAILWKGRKKAILGIKQSLLSFLLVFGISFLGALAVFAVTGLMYFGKKYYIVYSASLLVPGFFFLAFSVFGGSFRYFQKKFSLEHLLGGQAILWGIFSLVLLFFMRGGHHLFLVPFYASIAILAFHSIIPISNAITRQFCTLLVLLAPLMMWTGVLLSFYETLSSLFAFVYIFFFIMLCGFLFPFIYQWERFHCKMAVISLFISLSLMLTGYFEWKPNKERPEFTSLMLACDADTGKCFWYSALNQLDRWTRHVYSKSASMRPIREFIPDEKGMYLCDESTIVSSQLPAFTVQKLVSRKGILRLKLQYRKNFPILHVFADRPIEHAALDGEKLLPTEGNFFLKISGSPEHDPILELHCADTTPITLIMVAHDYFLPAGLPSFPMPEDMMMLSNIPDFNRRLFKSGETIIRRIFSFSW